MVIKNYKIIEENGIKYYQKNGKKLFSSMNYGINKIFGRDIQVNANIKVGFKVNFDKEYIMLEGYLNNKLIPGTDIPAKDSYGDIPTGDNVYNIDRLVNNPVALVDHENSASMIVGNFIFLEEDNQGLRFKEILRPIEDIHNPITKDVVSAWTTGFGKAYSIGGRWLYDMELSNPDNNEWILVKAILHETSHVAVGADQWALDSLPDNSFVSKEGKVDKNIDTLDIAIKKYIETKEEKRLVDIMVIKKERDKNG